MTDHALEAAKRILPPEIWFPTDNVSKQERLDYDSRLEDAAAIVESAIDAATADKDKRIAELEQLLSDSESLFESLEWIPNENFATERQECWGCGNVWQKDAGHKPDCRMARLLAAAQVASGR